MQFVETARRLELHAFSACTKSPKRYSTLLTNRIFEIASTVHEEVRAANNIYPKNKHEAQMRRDHLTNANIALQNLSPKLTLLYDAILQNPEKCPWIDHSMKDIRSSLDSSHGHMKRGNSYKVCQSADHYFKSLFGFYPDKKGWKSHV